MAAPLSAPSGPSRVEQLLLVADLAGVFVFALEGALKAEGGGFDLLGVAVLAFATALAGGIVRDVLLGALPPNAIADQRYPLTAFVGAGLVFVFHPLVRSLPTEALLVLDAGGLALCAVAGAQKGLLYGVAPLLCVLLGAITAVGGGTIRDLLMGKSPGILHTDVYASAALAGATALVLAEKLGLRPATAAVGGGLICFGVRLWAVQRGWSLPHFV